MQDSVIILASSMLTYEWRGISSLEALIHALGRQGSGMQGLNPQTTHHVLSFLDRKDLCTSSAVSRDFQGLVNGSEGDSIWHELFRRHWFKDVVEAAEAEKEQHPEETWRKLYTKAHASKLDTIVEPLNSKIFCIRGPMGSWDELSISHGGGLSTLLTPAERELILFNGHTFILRGIDWPPSGQEVGPCPGLEAHMAPFIAAAREKDRAADARLLAGDGSWEAIEMNEEVKMFRALGTQLQALRHYLDNYYHSPDEEEEENEQRDIVCLGGAWRGFVDINWGDVEADGGSEEIYFSRKGYFTVHEIARIALHRYGSCPEYIFGDHNFYSGLSGDASGWMIHFGS